MINETVRTSFEIEHALQWGLDVVIKQVCKLYSGNYFMIGRSSAIDGDELFILSLEEIVDNIVDKKQAFEWSQVIPEIASVLLEKNQDSLDSLFPKE